MCGVSAVTSIRDLSSSSEIRSRLGVIPRTQCRSKLAMPSASSRTLCRKLWAISGLKTLSSKLPEAPPSAIARSLAMTWLQSIVIASHWVGLTLPGMIELPGSFSGRLNSPSPQRGPEASQRISLAIFMSATASVFKPPCAATRPSCAASAANLLSALVNGSPVRKARPPATRDPNSGCVFSPVPTAVPPMASG